MSDSEALYDVHQHGELLTPEAASEYLSKKHAIKLGVQQLADLRSAGGGPCFIKPTQREVRYPTAMLDEWAAARNRRPILSFVPLKTTKPDPSTGSGAADEPNAPNNS